MQNKTDSLKIDDVSFVTSLAESGNLAPMIYWQRNRFNTASLDNAVVGLDSTLAVLFKFFIHKELDIVISEKVNATRMGHFPAAVDYMKDLVEKWDENLPFGGMLVWLEDGIWANAHHRTAPTFAFTKRHDDYYSLLMPDPAFITTGGYRNDLAEIRERYSALPWEVRRPTVYWRGASSGLGGSGESWRGAPRLNLCTHALTLPPDVIDAKITKAVKYSNNDSAAHLEAMGVMAPPVPFVEFLNYRYLIDIDGELSAWRSFFLKLCSGSVVLKVASPYEQWYYRRLIPWYHYIPVLADLSNLDEIIRWVHAHDKECKEIAENAYRLVSTFTYEHEVLISRALLRELFSYFTL